MPVKAIEAETAATRRERPSALNACYHRAFGSLSPSPSAPPEAAAPAQPTNAPDQRIPVAVSTRQPLEPILRGRAVAAGQRRDAGSGAELCGGSKDSGSWDRSAVAGTPAAWLGGLDRRISPERVTEIVSCGVKVSRGAPTAPSRRSGEVGR